MIGETEPNHYKTQQVRRKATAFLNKLSDQDLNDSDWLSARYK
jgi:hypothetical protein